MRRRLLSTVILCVALLTQFAASLSVASARAGFGDAFRCHGAIAVRAAGGADARPAGDEDAPPPHNHADCAYCQCGPADAPTPADVLAPRPIPLAWRVAIPAAEEPAPRFSSFNPGAPARASPSRL